MKIEAVNEVSRAGSTNAQETNARKGGHHEQALRIKEERDKKEEKPPKDLDEIASEVQLKLKRLNTELRFEVDGHSRDVTIKIIDPDNGKILRQIPSEELLAMRDRMDEIIGVLYKAET